VKLVSFRRVLEESWGVIGSQGIVDLKERSGFPTLRAALAGGAVDRLVDNVGSNADHALADVELLPPIPRPDKIICIGLNYAAHAAEAGLEIPQYPLVFLRLSSTLVGHDSPLVRPKLSLELDYEGELAVVIGKPGRHIARGQALDHVAGYACFNDVSVRDFQIKHSFSVGKNFPATGGFGPWLMRRRESPNPSDLTVVTRINGVEVQRGATSDMIVDVSSLISYVSGFTALVPGDVIATGTPAGVGFGRKPQLWLKPGDIVEVDIAGIGLLRNPVVDEVEELPAEARMGHEALGE
jgi:2-keto-4-pentenoate hydratase/2-oxohepta-3-ene-1,7-dioic acid hydratase in catechol pathway